MPLVSMRQLLDEAAKGGYGVGAFNVNDMEQIQAIMIAATETKSPVIVQASRVPGEIRSEAFKEGWDGPELTPAKLSISTRRVELRPTVAWEHKSWQ